VYGPHDPRNRTDAEQAKTNADIPIEDVVDFDGDVIKSELKHFSSSQFNRSNINLKNKTTLAKRYV